jgi:uncharacterized protein with PIN domain
VDRRAHGGGHDWCVAALVVLHVPEPLQFFLRPGRRLRDVRVDWDGQSSLGHVVESVGVPLTEVEALLVDGVSVSPAYRPRDGDVAIVVERRRPQALPTASPRFVLDVHLGALARRLRLLGLDTAYGNDATDDSLVARALGEDRMLLTQDRGLLRRRALRENGLRAAYVRGSQPDEQLFDVIDRFDPPLAPFSRCPACNGSLEVVAKADVLDRLESGTRRCYDDFRQCHDCSGVYWRGAHSKRLDEIVVGATGRSGVRR